MRATPLFKDPLPFMRPHIAGWEVGDLVAFPDAKARSLERRGRVLASLPHHDMLVLRATCPDAIVEINPQRCRKIAGLVRRSPQGEAG